MKLRQTLEGAIVGAIVGAIISAAAYTVTVRIELSVLREQVQGVSDNLQDSGKRIERIENLLLSRGARP